MTGASGAKDRATPAGLPYGDKAVLAQVDCNAGGLVFIIDGDKACTPMAIPHELLAMMHDVATETINHETGGLSGHFVQPFAQRDEPRRNSQTDIPRLCRRGAMGPSSATSQARRKRSGRRPLRFQQMVTRRDPKASLKACCGKKT
jgi:hypothetical protein